jgi:hypothetical protein
MLALVHLGEVGLEHVCHYPNRRQIRDRERGRRACLQQLSWCDEPLDNRAGNRRTNYARYRSGTVPVRRIRDHSGIDAERSYLLERRLPVSERRRGVGLGLLEIAARQRISLEELRVLVGNSLKVCRRRNRLAVPLETTVPGCTSSFVTGPETGDNTCVDLSPLNATVPVVDTLG